MQVRGDQGYARQSDGVGENMAMQRKSIGGENDRHGWQPKRAKIRAACLLALALSFNAAAEPLDTRLPASQEDSFLVMMDVNLPAQPLAMSLKQFATSAGLSLAFDSNLAENKMAPAVKGRMSRKEALRRILAGSGLGADLAGSTAVISNQASTESITTNVIPVRAKRFYEVGPLPGLGLTKEEIPGNVQSITAQEIKDSHSLSITDLMNRKLQSVNVNDYQGNPFQMDVTYRGFTAGPQIGTPQGLSVFMDGIRVNEPFGDVVNWDMIPMNALAGVDVFPGSNPIFGLNTLGGAFSMRTKNGFDDAGVDAEVLTGSFGRRQLQASGGWNNGTVGLFGAGNFFLEDGWRENSPSKVNQVFGKASYRGEKLDLNLSTLYVWNDLVGNGLLPSEMYAQNKNGVFTSPDTTDNRLAQFQLSSSYFVNDSFTVTGQVYRRNSKRHQVGADVFTGFAGEDEAFARRIPAAGEQYTCLFSSHNQFGLPDYYVITVDATVDAFGEFFNHPFVLDSLANGFVGDPNSPLLPVDALNKPMPPEVLAYFQQQYNVGVNYFQNLIYERAGNQIAPLPPAPINDFGEFDYYAGTFDSYSFMGYPSGGVIVATAFDTYYWTVENGVPMKNFVMLLAPTNAENCLATQSTAVTGTGGQGAFTYIDPETGAVATIDGALTGGTGVVEGTPTAVLTDNQIEQIVDGVSVQFNWNLERHKFMIGASIDAARAKYSNEQQLGLLDASRDAYLAPDLIHPQFAGADIPLSNNDFSGTNLTKSVYFSETWNPVETWHFSASARYNETQTKNKIATRWGVGAFELGEFIAYPDRYNICPNGDCSNVAANYKLPDVSKVLNAGETEKFSYYSFNPSLGATWQAKENLNLYANWAQGTRTPSVIELGCAFDDTPVASGTNSDGSVRYVPKSIYENRSCSLPTTLSGDPYLPQIKANTYDIGIRGTIGNSMQWNLGAYQTDLKDDIYFVAVGNGRGFFDSIGDTRRRGIEAGFSGGAGKARFSLNYALTDATFQNDFFMFSADNSSAITVNGFGNGVINVKPGDRMPGVPLHNLNASVSYDVTDKWTVGLSAVVHSESFVRGNENNEHEKGVVRTFQSIRYVGGVPEVYTRILPPTRNPGKVPGYATFNFQTSYKLAPEWTASLLINNLFDKEYFTAGRLGRNPFSPSIFGAIGPDGYNHNSDDWRSTNFIAPGAPRGIWFSLNYRFDARK
ncbi:Ferric-pseudobactin BN7/BN8 receptor [Methylophilaceae bacterium]|nr:Ferric-pseudobactin BN7/BN8 receptor [Methylophilaceae bacterium]